MVDVGRLKRSATYHAQRAMGATFGEVAGWELPASYIALEKELDQTRRAGGVADVSHLGKIGVQGEVALPELARALSIQQSIEVGWVGEATDIDGVRVCGLSYDEALVLTPPEIVGDMVKRLEDALEGCAHLVDETSVKTGIWVVGPHSHRVLARLVELDLDPRVFGPGRCDQGRGAEVHLLVLRADVGDLLGYQLFVTRDFGEYLWEAVLHAGRKEGVGPLGYQALERLDPGAPRC